jgi:glycosyltransferase involved in cell wall biosynthesis
MQRDRLMTGCICYVLGGTNLSGAEKRIIFTAIETARIKKGAVSIVMSSQLFEEVITYSRFSGVEFHGLQFKVISKPKLKSNGLKRIRRLISICYNFFRLIPTRGTIIHITLFDRSMLAALSLLRLYTNNKFIFEITSPDRVIHISFKILIKNRWLFDRIICVSKNVARLSNNYIGDDNSRVINKIIERTNPYVSAIPISNEKIEKKENIVVYAHRLISRKNPILVTKVFASLAKKYPEWKFKIYGQGPLQYTIKNLCKEYNLENLEFCGYSNAIIQILEKSKIFVSMIEPDNYPSQAIFEALCNANTLLLSDTGETRKRFYSGGNGKIVPIEFEAIKSALEELLSSNQIQNYCINALNFFNKNYSKERYLNENLQIYSSL